MQYVIDKIEDGWAELEDGNGKVYGVPADWLQSCNLIGIAAPLLTGLLSRTQDRCYVTVEKR
jgi:hypothetical protein